MSFKSHYDDEQELYRFNIREIDAEWSHLVRMSPGIVPNMDNIKAPLMIVIRGEIRDDVTHAACHALRAFTQAEVAYYEDGEMEASATYKSHMLTTAESASPFIKQLLFEASER